MTFQSEWGSGNFFNDQTTPMGFFGGNTLEGGGRGQTSRFARDRANFQAENRQNRPMLGPGLPGGVSTSTTTTGNGNTYDPAQHPGQGGVAGPGGSSTSTADPGNFGQAMHPWDMPYQGQFTAPMSPYEQNALNGYSDFVGGGMGLNQSGNYLNDVLGGKYLDLNRNPYLQQIQEGEQGIKDYNDKMALDKIGSSMALGGNALSGARLGATSDYMRNSNNAFESMMGQLMNQNYGLERGAMSQAPGQAANLANTASSGYGQLFGMGALPRNLQQHDYDSQYSDFMRQTGAMNHDYERPDNQLLQFLSGAGYKGQYQPTYGSSVMDQIGALAGQGGWGDILSQLFGGAVEGASGTDQNQNTGVQFDGRVIGYDGASAPTTPPASSAGPANYYDKDWYLNALTQASAKQKATANAKPPNTNAAAIAAILMSLLGTKTGGKSKGGISMGGGGGSLANTAGKAAGKGIKSLWDDIFGPKKAGVDPFTAPSTAGNVEGYDPSTGGWGNVNPGGSESYYGPYSPEAYDNPAGYFDTPDSVGGPLFDPSNYAGGGNDYMGGNEDWSDGNVF